MFCCSTSSPLRSNTNKSLWDAPHSFQTSLELLSVQTGELLLEVQLPEEEEL